MPPLPRAMQDGAIEVFFSYSLPYIDCSATYVGEKAMAPQSMYMGENRRKTLSTTFHSSWEMRRVNLIFLPNTGWDVS